MLLSILLAVDAPQPDTTTSVALALIGLFVVIVTVVVGPLITSWVGKRRETATTITDADVSIRERVSRVEVRQDGVDVRIDAVDERLGRYDERLRLVEQVSRRPWWRRGL